MLSEATKIMIFILKKLNKIAVSRTDDKRIIMEDGDMGTFDYLFITLFIKIFIVYLQNYQKNPKYRFSFGVIECK